MGIYEIPTIRPALGETQGGKTHAQEYKHGQVTGCRWGSWVERWLFCLIAVARYQAFIAECSCVLRTFWGCALRIINEAGELPSLLEFVFPWRERPFKNEDKSLRVVSSKWQNFMVYKLYLNEVVQKILDLVELTFMFALKYFILIICGFCFCKFAYLSKFIYDPRTNIWLSCGHSQMYTVGQKHWVAQHACSQLRQNEAVLCLLVPAHILWTSVLFAVDLVPLFFLFVFFCVLFGISVFLNGPQVTCWSAVSYAKAQDGCAVPYGENVCVK